MSIFDRSRGGFRPSDLALELARRAETIETQLAETLELVTKNSSDPAGLLRLTTTDTILQGLLLPLLADFSTRYSSLQLELVTTNQLASRRRREADLAIRATLHPPPVSGRRESWPHRSRGLRERHLPASTRARLRARDCALDRAGRLAGRASLGEVACQPLSARGAALSLQYILSIVNTIEQGLGVGVIPLFLASGHGELQQLTSAIAELGTDLWLLAHPDVRHLQRVKLLFDFLRERLALPLNAR